MRRLAMLTHEELRELRRKMAVFNAEEAVAFGNRQVERLAHINPTHDALVITLDRRSAAIRKLDQAENNNQANNKLAPKKLF